MKERLRNIAVCHHERPCAFELQYRYTVTSVWLRNASSARTNHERQSANGDFVITVCLHDLFVKPVGFKGVILQFSYQSSYLKMLLFLCVRVLL